MLDMYKRLTDRITSGGAGKRSFSKRSEDRDISAPVTFSRFGQKIDSTPYRALHRPIVKDEPVISASAPTNASQHSPPQSQDSLWSWAPMHLQRMVQITKGCKEVIWEAYEKLYGNGPMIKPVLGVNSDRSKKNTARDEFETAWMNCEKCVHSSLLVSHLFLTSWANEM